MWSNASIRLSSVRMEPQHVACHPSCRLPADDCFDLVGTRLRHPGIGWSSPCSAWATCTLWPIGTRKIFAGTESIGSVRQPRSHAASARACSDFLGRKRRLKRRLRQKTYSRGDTRHRASGRRAQSVVTMTRTEHRSISEMNQALLFCVTGVKLRPMRSIRRVLFGAWFAIAQRRG